MKISGGYPVQSCIRLYSILCCIVHYMMGTVLCSHEMYCTVHVCVCVCGVGDEIQEARWRTLTHTHTHTPPPTTMQPLAEASTLSSHPQSSLGVPWGAHRLLLIKLQDDLEDGLI